MSFELQGEGMEVDFAPQNWLPWQHPLRDRKNNFRSFIYGQRPTNLANFVKIGPVDVEIIVLTETTKYAKKIKLQQNMSPPRQRFSQSGWAKKLSSCLYAFLVFRIHKAVEQRQLRVTCRVICLPVHVPLMPESNVENSIR